jgi:hypothetical protein
LNDIARFVLTTAETLPLQKALRIISNLSVKNLGRNGTELPALLTQAFMMHKVRRYDTKESVCWSILKSIIRQIRDLGLALPDIQILIFPAYSKTVFFLN